MQAYLLTYLLTYLLSKLENEISGAEGDLPAMAEFLRRTDVRVREALGLGGGSGRGTTVGNNRKTKWVEYVKFECVSAGHVPHARWCG